MATDGPAIPEQARPSTEGKGGLFSRFRKSEAKPATTTSTPPKKEDLPGKMGKVMAELKKKDQELEGTFVGEFGEGENKFIALADSVRTNEGADLPEGERMGKQGFQDYLLVVNDRFRILRVEEGKFQQPDLIHKNRFPDAKDQYDGTDANDVMIDVTRQLIKRGNSALREREPIHWGRRSLEGSGYRIDKDMHELNFGGGPSLKFFESPYSEVPKAYFQGPEAQLRKYLGDNRSSYGESADRGLNGIRGENAQLILNPDQAEVNKIIQTNIENAKAAKDRRDAAKLAEEAKKLAEAQKTRRPEIEKANQEDARRKKDEEQVVAQSQAADSALDLLGKL